MNKLQHMLDTAFGRPNAEREPQAPSELYITRERELAERARKIEALRQARLTRDATRH
jgi:hypothetical protein